MMVHNYFDQQDGMYWLNKLKFSQTLSQTQLKSWVIQSASHATERRQILQSHNVRDSYVWIDKVNIMQMILVVINFYRVKW